MSRSNPIKWKWYVYIIECKNKTYYTGLTWNSEIRYEQHLSKFGSKYTAKHGIKKLVYIEDHDNLEVARNREKQIKGWSQKKKEKLIIGAWGKYWDQVLDSLAEPDRSNNNKKGTKHDEEIN